MNIFKLSKLFMNQKGMSLTEIMIAMGVLGAIVLGGAAIMDNLNTGSKNADAMIEKTNFASSLGKYLNSPMGCEQLKVATGATTFSKTESPFQITEWKYNGIKVFGKDTKLKYFKISSMTARMETDTVSPKININKNGVSIALSRTIIRIKVMLELLSNPKRIYEHTYDLSALVNDSQKVEACYGTNSFADTCKALSGKFNDLTQQCMIDEACYTYGSYITLNCYPVVGGGCDTSRGIGKVNPVTGDYTCPVGTTALSTGIDTWSTTKECGKKCEADINHTMGYYTCVQCP